MDKIMPAKAKLMVNPAAWAKIGKFLIRIDKSKTKNLVQQMDKGTPQLTL